MEPRDVAPSTALIWRVLLVAERCFRSLHHPKLLAEVAAGTHYEDGVRLVPLEPTAEEVAA